MIFLTLEETGVTRHLDESGSNKDQYEVQSGIESFIKFNNETIQTLSTGMGFTLITNDKVVLHRTYRTFNESDLAAIRFILEYDCDFIIINSNVDLPYSVIEIMKGVGAKNLVQTTGCAYICLYSRWTNWISTERFSYQQASIKFTGLIESSFMDNPTDIPEKFKILNLCTTGGLEFNQEIRSDSLPRFTTGFNSQDQLEFCFTLKERGLSYTGESRTEDLIELDNNDLYEISYDLNCSSTDISFVADYNLLPRIEVKDLDEFKFEFLFNIQGSDFEYQGDFITDYNKANIRPDQVTQIKTLSNNIFEFSFNAEADLLPSYEVKENKNKRITHRVKGANLKISHGDVKNFVIHRATKGFYRTDVKDQHIIPYVRYKANKITFRSMMNNIIEYNTTNDQLGIPYTPRFDIREDYTDVIIRPSSDTVIYNQDQEDLGVVDCLYINAKDQSIGINGFVGNLSDINIPNEPDVIMRLYDYVHPKGGQWYTDKINGEWILETDDLGEPIQNWFVQNPSMDIRQKVIDVNNFKEDN